MALRECSRLNQGRGKGWGGEASSFALEEAEWKRNAGRGQGEEVAADVDETNKSIQGHDAIESDSGASKPDRSRTTGRHESTDGVRTASGHTSAKAVKQLAEPCVLPRTSRAPRAADHGAHLAGALLCPPVITGSQLRGVD
eukprot:scaffold35875_cov112-Isochrysis_galbana.AAC.4